MRTIRHRCFAALTAALLVASFPAGYADAAPAQEQREVRRTFSGGGGTTVDVENLAGTITVEGIAGGDIEILATIHAVGGRQADAQTLLGLLDVAFDQTGSRIEVRADYPVERFDTYRYPGSGRGRFNTNPTYQRERITVTSRDDDDAVTLYADFVLRLPPGVSVDVENSVGDVTAGGTRGDIRAETGSGNVIVRTIVGTVEADTGSGNVEVEEVDGDVLADTGSGNVVVRNVRGNIDADTGSGNVTVTDVEGRSILAGTGSGDITFERVSGDLDADTGSGDIIGRDIVSGASIVADTASGNVRLEGDLSGARHIEIDTSSGDVDLDLVAYPGMSIGIETGSGRITVDLPDLQTERSRRNYFRGTVGDGAADLAIDTGSGNVRIRAR
jgi:DUF4097 and DUF4098 domain-containing protein YvlB